ncbi:uncharacterized protein LOC144874981 [Branchiostoma floridae x Branchiostoma japonicum]
MTPGKQDNEPRTRSPSESVHCMRSKPGRLWSPPAPLLVGVLVLLLTVGVTRGQTIGEFKTDDEKGIAAVKAPGGTTCYIVDGEPGEGDEFVISLDESRSDQPTLSREITEFCKNLAPRWAIATPAGKDGSGGDVIIDRHTGRQQEA